MASFFNDKGKAEGLKKIKWMAGLFKLMITCFNFQNFLTF